MQRRFQCAAPAGGVISRIGDASGNWVALAPEWVASLAAQYEIPTAFGDVVLTGSYTYNGKMYYDVQNLIRRSGLNIFNATASWSATESITFQVWGNNLTNEHYYAQVQSAPPRNFVYYPAPPRTYGFTVKYAFK